MIGSWVWRGGRIPGLEASMVTPFFAPCVAESEEHILVADLRTGLIVQIDLTRRVPLSECQHALGHKQHECLMEYAHAGLPAALNNAIGGAIAGRALLTCNEDDMVIGVRCDAEKVPEFWIQLDRTMAH